LVKPDDVHQFKNVGDKPLKFLCLIPNSADNRPGVAPPECSSVGANAPLNAS
jgi:quercetin dioxygenase-like cupin family protein